MSDGHIQVPPDSTGKKVDQEVLTVAGQQVYRPRNVSSDPVDADGHGRVKNTIPAAADYGQVTREAPAGLLEAAINFSTAGDHDVLPAPGVGVVIKVWKMWIWSNGDDSLSIRDGATPLAGPIDLAQGGALMLPKDSDPWFTLTANSPFNLNTTQAVQKSGRVYYTQG